MSNFPPANNGMSKAQRRAAEAQRREAELAAAARRQRLRIAGLATAAVVLVIALIVVFALATKKSPAPKAAPATDFAHDVKVLTSIPASTYDKVGAGTTLARPKKTAGPVITEKGKPVVIYVGAEFCPFCAGERWALVAALSRFGTFSHLGQASSAADDVYPSTSTLTFHGATYSSKYVTFSGTEVQDDHHQPLDTPPARDNKLWTTIGQGGFPFVDLGGAYALSGAQYLPDALHGGSQDGAALGWDEIAKDLADPTTPISTSINGSANVLTAEICTLTHNQPANVCTSAGVTAAK